VKAYFTKNSIKDYDVLRFPNRGMEN